MGILIDVILIAIILLSAFLGYKKGLVKLGTKLFAGIIAIIITLIAYKPVSGLIINNTQLDEKIENVIIEKTENVAGQVGTEIVSEQTENISTNIIYVITTLVLFVVVKILLGIVISLVDVVAKLPILKQFNETGGLVYGIVRGALIVCICILLAGVYTKIKPESTLNDKIQKSFLTKIVYENIVKF